MWDEKTEKNLKFLSVQCQIYSILQLKTGIFNSRIDLLLNTISILLSSISATLLTIPGFEKENGDPVLGSVLFLSSFISGSSHLLSLRTKSKENEEFSKKFQILNNKIKSQLILTFDDREDSVDFLSDITENMNEFILKQPPVNYFISGSFLKTIKSKKIFLPSNETIFDNISLSIKSHNSEEFKEKIDILIKE